MKKNLRFFLFSGQRIQASYLNAGISIQEKIYSLPLYQKAILLALE